MKLKTLSAEPLILLRRISHIAAFAWASYETVLWQSYYSQIKMHEACYVKLVTFFNRVAEPS